MISRRRFLTIAAASVVTPAAAEPTRWSGVALGADVAMTLHAAPEQAARAVQEVRALLQRIEALFSLYDPMSQLSQLNRTGILRNPPPEWLDLLAIADRVHHASNGAFDPTIQPLWRALATGKHPSAARALVNWSRVRVAPGSIRIDPGQALTLNGIAQGYATDLVASHMRRAGLTRVLVNIGEYAGVGGPWRLGLSDPVHGLVDTSKITDRAVATSSPAALALDARNTHILGPSGQAPLWSTVSVTANSAALADAASTAFCLMDAPAIQSALHNLPGSPTATLVDRTGDVKSIG